MYSLSSAAGGRWKPLDTGESKTSDLFERYIQSVERTVDLITFRLQELLEFDDYYLKHNGEAVWRHELATVMHIVREGETTALAAIAPDGFEGMVAFYDLHAKACGEAAKAIDQYLDGLGPFA